MSGLGLLRRERPDHTLQAPAVLHEAYLRLVEKTPPIIDEYYPAC